MGEARLIYARLKENYDSARDELKSMMETFSALSGFHSRSHFNSKLSALCNSKNRSFREAVITIVCKTSAISSQDGKVGMKDDGIEERMLDSLCTNCTNAVDEELHRRLSEDLIEATDFASLAQSSMETYGNYSNNDEETGKVSKSFGTDIEDELNTNKRQKSLDHLVVGDRIEMDFSGKWYGGVVTVITGDKIDIDFDDGDKEKNVPKNPKNIRLEVAGKHVSAITDTDLNDEIIDGRDVVMKENIQVDNKGIENEWGEEAVYDALEAKYGNINDLEAKVKMQAETISTMEASLRENENDLDPDPLNTSNESNAYEDDFEASKSPAKMKTLNKHELDREDNSLIHKYEANKIESYTLMGEIQEDVREKKSAAAHARGIKAIGAMRKSLSKESATSDILSMANKLLDGDHDDILGFNGDQPNGMKKPKKKKKMTRRTEDSQKTSISKQHAINNDVRDAKVVNKLRKVVKSSSAPDGVFGGDERRRARLQNYEENVNRLEKVVAMKDLGAIDLLKLLREKSTSALEILFRANNILNNKLNSAYKISLKDLQERQQQEIERLDTEAQMIGEENMVNANSLTVEKSRKANSKHRVDVYRNRLKEKHQAEADAIWDSLQPPMKHLDDVYGEQVLKIKTATDRAAAVGKRSVELMEKYSRDPNLRNKTKLLDKLNDQTRKAVFDSCHVIADICGNVKHVYTSLSDSLFTSDGGIIGLNVGGWRSETLRASVSTPPSLSKSKRVDGSSETRSPIGNIVVDNKAYYEENEDASRVLSPNHSPTVLDNFNKALDIEMTRTIGPRASKPPSPSYISATKEAMMVTTAILSPDSNYDDDFEGEESPTRQDNFKIGHNSPNKLTQSPTKSFLDSLSKSSGLKPADNILEASGDDYEDDFEGSPVRYEYTKQAKSSKLVEQDHGFQGDYVSECERLGIDPNSSWRLLDRRSDRANPTLKKKKKDKGEKKRTSEEKRISIDVKSQCYLCKKMYSGAGKSLPNMNSLDQPAVDMVKNMVQRQNEEYARSGGLIHSSDNNALSPGGSSRLFCSWKCVKVWNKKNTPLQLRYHTEVMIDFAAALAAEDKGNKTRN